MKHEKIDDKARVWIVTRGTNGQLEDQVDPQFLTRLDTACSAEDVANIIATAAGEMEVAHTRAW
jgi:hypothetical protein